jgi:hypothetical protein
MDIERGDLPVCVIPAGEEYVLYDVHGVERARFATIEEAQKKAEEINGQQPPELMQQDIHDTGTEPVPSEQEKPVSKPKAKPAKRKAKSKGKSMPRGIPNKKRASKKSAVKPMKKAAAVKKTAKKTTKRKKRKA